MKEFAARLSCLEPHSISISALVGQKVETTRSSPLSFPPFEIPFPYSQWTARLQQLRLSFTDSGISLKRQRRARFYTPAAVFQLCFHSDIYLSICAVMLFLCCYSDKTYGCSNYHYYCNGISVPCERCFCGGSSFGSCCCGCSCSLSLS